jgi:hypothetical protein
VAPDPLTIAVELVRNDRRVEDRGCNAEARTHRDRPDWAAVVRRDRAVNHLAAELIRDFSDASTEDVLLVTHAGSLAPALAGR